MKGNFRKKPWLYMVVYMVVPYITGSLYMAEGMEVQQ